MPTIADVSQGGLIGIARGDSEQRVSQAGLVAVAAVQPVNGVSQAGLIVVGYAVPCFKKWCQVWIIERRDGQTFRFTSHDRDVTWGEDTFKACGSLDQTASEQTNDMGHAGNIELSGLLSDDSITEEDLFAGLFDDASAEVWRIDLDGIDAPRRLAAGNLGAVTQGKTAFTAELLGPGARLQQKPMLEIVGPACGWEFGSPDCGVDAEALAISGTVEVATRRSFFVASIVDPGGAAQWNLGKVRWTSGENAGLECEVMTVDFATGVIVLWSPTAFVPQPGDGFDLLPGCDLAFDGGCTAYDNKINHGGFPHVPGQDAIQRTPDAKA